MVKKTGRGVSSKTPPASDLDAVTGGAEKTREKSGKRVAHETTTTTWPVETGSNTPAIPIVGIGASAGGLDAFKRFLAAMPADSGMAFVLIPHLDPTHESLMVELLTRHTEMPVVEAKHGTPVGANHVYVIPPNKYLAIEGGVLQLSAPPKPRGLRTAIDFFLRSLAMDQGERAIGIVLSGTGSHGTQGVREIKLVGGMVMAQETESAEYDQMPRSAIASGVVDYVLPPEQMPEVLVKYMEQPYLNRLSEPASLPEEAAEQLDRILALLRTRTKYDFRSYRKNMLMRRMQRRMGLRHIEQFAAYLDLLRESIDEVTALRKDLLIGVTAFFREDEAFNVLEQQVIPELVERAADQKAIRVWVPACATGEEAYSIAMLLMEGFAAADQPLNLQIFASDIDDQSLDAARAGIYPVSIAGDVSPERLKRFFFKTHENHYQVNKQLRESIVFAPQNLISDAPFSRLDLISCRNLLIYLEPEVQEKVVALFHFALGEDGYLLLGPSESIGRAVDLFEPISKKWRVYRRIGPVRRELVDIPIVATPERRGISPRAGPTSVPSLGFKELTEKLILSDYAPAAALINRKYEILYVTGPLVDYLEFPTGELTKDLLAMTRQGLRTKIRAACQQAMHEGQVVTDAEARVKRDRCYVPCIITVRPLTEPKEAEGLILVTFQDRGIGPQPKPGSEAPGLAHRTGEDQESKLVQQLELELKSTREDLQSTIEEMESSNEELKTSNEEAMSMNEELQSANEELETSKEELQSLNEELRTVNNQLQDKVGELGKANSDMINLIASSDIATVFLDTELRIVRFTPPAAKLLNLLATDVGRPFRDFAPRFTNDNLLDECQMVLDKLTPVECELRTADRRYYLRRILPYRTADDRIDGVAITYVEISARVKAEAESRRLATVVRDSNDAVTIQSRDGHILVWNRGAERMYGYSEAEALKMNIRDLVPEQLRDEALATVRRIAEGQASESLDTQRLTKDGRTLDVWLTVSKLTDEAGEIVAIATTERDVTDRAHEFRLLAEAVSNLGEGVMITSDELDWPGPEIIYVNAALCRITGYAAEELIGRTPRILQGNMTDKQALQRLRKELSEKRSHLCELVNHRKDGTSYAAELFITPLFDTNGKRTNFIAVHRDVSRRKRAEVALRASEAQTRAILASLSAHIAVIDREGIIVAANPAWEQFAKDNAGIAARCNVGANYFSVCRDVIGPGAEEARKVAAGLRAVLDGDANQFALEYPCHSATHNRWFLLHITPLHIEESRGAVVSHTNITDRVQAEQSMRDREERLRTILNTAADAIITIDQHAIIDSVNVATEKMFGYTQDELVGQNVNILMPAPYCDEHGGYIARYLATGEARLIGTGRDVTGRRRDGSIFPVSLAVSRVEQMGLFTGIIRDISEQRRLQRDVVAIAEDEQRRIGQDLHDSTQQELAGLGMLAQTLLFNLAKQADDLPEGSAAKLSELAKKIVEGIARTHQQVQTISRGLVPFRLDDDGFMDALRELAARTDELEGITCAFKCEQPVEVADSLTATHLYRIAQEAVTNALKHGRPEHILIALELENGCPVLQIADDGTGFDSTPAGEGLGLKTMAYRASLIGANLVHSPVETGGTLVTCKVYRGGGE